MYRVVQTPVPTLRRARRKMPNQNPKSHRWSRCYSMRDPYETMGRISSLGWKMYVHDQSLFWLMLLLLLIVSRQFGNTWCVDLAAKAIHIELT